jgi:ankyrin repeat protein
MPKPSPTSRLFSAIKAKDLPEVMASIALGADINDKNSTGRGHLTPLEFSAMLGFDDSVAALLNAACLIPDPFAALNYAVRGESLTALQLILDAPSSCVGLDWLQHLMLRAAGNQRLDMCKLLIQRGADPRVCDKDGRGPLNHALTDPFCRDSKSIVEFVEFLIESGAPTNTIDVFEQPLTSAIRICLNNQKFIDDGVGQRLCGLLIKGGAFVNSVGPDNSSPLHEVVMAISTTPLFDPALIPLLIKSGADINKKDPIGITPLHCAVIYENASAIKQLIATGAAVNAANNKGLTALHMASDVTTAKLLLEAGADPSILTIDGETAEAYAKSAANFEVHAFLCVARHQTQLEVSITDAALPSIRPRI